MPDPTPRREYVRRLNAAIDYIETHLAEPISLEELASVANFSPFHFHRVFASHLGETLGAYLKRRRLEWAARRLLSNRHARILSIAIDCGFGSAEVFSRSFHSHFGMTPTAWRSQGYADRGRQPQDRKHDQVVRNGGQADRNGDPEDGDSQHLIQEYTMNRPTDVTISDQPAVRVAYLRQFGPYGPSIAGLWQRFMQWCGAQNIHGTMYGVSWDEPAVTAPEKCRYDACVVVGDGFQPSGEIAVQALPAGRYAKRPFCGTSATVEKAWAELIRDWLPDSGYQLDDRPCYEQYRPETAADWPPQGFCCDLCIPIRPL